MYSTPHITLYFVGKKNTEATFCVIQQNFHKLINYTSFSNCYVRSLMTQYFLVMQISVKNNESCYTPATRKSYVFFFSALNNYSYL